RSLCKRADPGNQWPATRPIGPNLPSSLEAQDSHYQDELVKPTTSGFLCTGIGFLCVGVCLSTHAKKRGAQCPPPQRYSRTGLRPSKPSSHHCAKRTWLGTVVTERSSL